MKLAERMIFGCLLTAAAVAVGQNHNVSSQPTQPPRSANQKSQATIADRGQRVFHEECSRCHQEPQGFSSSISGTIARHMRVRAGISDEDYKALLKFLNP
jgi:mono/diheme cytochrome c family protein